MIKHLLKTWKSFNVDNTLVDQRLQLLHDWVAIAFAQLGMTLAPDWRLETVSGDASFRRYFRIYSHQRSWIAVDAPPDKEDSRAFVEIARAWGPLEIAVPRVLLADLEQGLMLLTDLGDVLYLDRLDAASADRLYAQALQTLIRIQQCRTVSGERLPPYSRALLHAEMGLFRDWFLGQQLGLSLTGDEQRLLDTLFDSLVVSALSQPQVCVHRDYHSRNLMVIEGSAPGVIDFQDAVVGPITYDLVSLLRDCYIAWPETQVEGWALDYAAQAVQAGLMEQVLPERFMGWFTRMGMQRHLKAIGIFARLNIRDAKSAYLQDIPRTLNYLRQAARQYPDCAAFDCWLSERVIPAMAETGLFDMSSLDRSEGL
ncbi:MAG: aminoglycoside/choline kinase family phosphotransferase [Motiliproteus sp.]|jgi:aminoglycoside/choline kinase family phosphotransferase